MRCKCGPAGIPPAIGVASGRMIPAVLPGPEFYSSDIQSPAPAQHGAAFRRGTCDGTMNTQPADLLIPVRSEESRVGIECVSSVDLGRSRIIKTKTED